MNEQLVGLLSSLLKIESTELTPLLDNEEGVNKLLEKSKTLTIFKDNEELNNFKANAGIDYLQNALKNNQSIDQGVYNQLKLNILSSKEKDISKKFGIEKYDSFDDLINKISTKQTQQTPQTNDLDLIKKEYEDKLNEKNNLVDSLKADYETKVNNIQINNIKTLAFDKLATMLDVAEEKLKIRLETINETFDARYLVEIKDNKQIVSSKKTGEVIKNEKLDPKTLFEVLVDHAKGIDTPFKNSHAASGHGTKTTATINTSGLTEVTQEQLFKIYEQRGAKTPIDQQKVLIDLYKENPKIKISN